MKQNRTRTAIADAFVRLLAEHTIDRITIHMITDEVGCSRKTFYYYFTDIFDLTRYICDQRVSAHLSEHADAADAGEGVRTLMAFLSSERTVVLNMFHGYGKEALERFTWQTVENYTRTLIAGNSEGKALPREELEPLIRMYSYMFFGMVVDWVGNEMAGDCSRTLDLALRALPHVIESLKSE